MTVIGIDLGTTNSLVAYWTDNGPVIIPNVLGETSTPSVVSVDENGEILVGRIAKERLISHPDLSAATFKRYMGTEKIYQLGSHKFTPEELSSFVIKCLKADAEAFFGHEVKEAVISVPAYFNDTQRKATKLAAEIAGLKVERLISEPTAAAISYGLHLERANTKFLVFDLGGGTFDVSILEFFEGVMEVQSIAGDNYLGGEDFTQLLVIHFADTHGIELPSLDPKTYSVLIKQAELCKLAISDERAGRMSLLVKDHLYELTIDRNDFERIAGQLILRLRHPIDRALRDASLTPDDLDAVILIGGATRMAMIKSIVTKLFKRLPFSQINPDEAVALGAAIQVALKERNEALNEIILTDVCPYTLGIETTHSLANGGFDGGHFSPIIERNTPIPVSKVEQFCTLQDGQKQIRVVIYQGESRKVANNLKLGELEVKVPSDAAGKQTIDVRFTYDINGILEVQVTTLSTGVQKNMIIEKNPGKLTKQEIEQRLTELMAIKIHPRERTENRLLLAMGERLYEEMLGEKRAQLTALLDHFEQVLASQNEHDIRKAATVLKNQLEQLERWRDY
jgi:molecular chaperone HscC